MNAALSPPLQYTFEHSNSGIPLITAKQYNHKLQVLSPILHDHRAAFAQWKQLSKEKVTNYPCTYEHLDSRRKGSKPYRAKKKMKKKKPLTKK